MERSKKTRSLLKKTDNGQLRSILVKKMKPVIVETYPSLQSISQTVSSQVPSYTQHTLPLPSFQSCFQSPIISTRSPIQSPEKGHQPIIMNEIILPSTSSTPLNQITDSISPEQEQQPIMMNEIILPSTSSTSTNQTAGLVSPLRSLLLNNNSQSEVTSDHLPIESLEKLHQSLTAVDSSEKISSKVTLSRGSSDDTLPDVIGKVIYDSFDTSNRTKVITMHKRRESKKFYFHYTRDGEILDARRLDDQMSKNIVKEPNDKRYLKCICSCCQESRNFKKGRSNTLFDHLRNQQDIKISCVYCGKSFITLGGCKRHVKEHHWKLGELL